MTELMVLPSDKKGIEQVFIEGQDIDSTITKIREEAKNLPTDMSVRKNREEVASFAYKIARSKTAVDKAGMALSAEYKEIPKKIDANRRVYKDAFERLQEEVRSPLNQWEQAEKERVQRHEQKIDWLSNWGDQLEYASSEIIKQRIAEIEAVELGESWEEYEAEAASTKDKALTGLRTLLASTEQREAEQAELEKLRAEAAEREQKEREERIAREAAEKARQEQADALAKAQAEKELAEQRRIAQEKQAELDKIEAEKRAIAQAEAAKQAEIDRQAAEAKRIEDERLAREADKEHKSAINRQALADLIEHANITEEQAKAVVVAIAKNQVTHVKINY